MLLWVNGILLHFALDAKYPHRKLTSRMQVCRMTFGKVIYLKKHLCSMAHLGKMKEIFPKACMNTTVFLPIIVFVDPKSKEDFRMPVVGLSLITLCVSEQSKAFYLCHVCEQYCQLGNILGHIYSHDHYIHYFNYTNPNQLNFSWRSQVDVKQKLWQEEDKDLQKLQILHLPRELLIKLQSRTYSEVMQMLCENGTLLKQFEALQPERKTLQSYQNDKQRKHPLLGIQHVVECVCVGPRGKRHYLCSLCNQTITSRMIINHILSFDHIYFYFNAWHPSTLKSQEFYRNCNTFVPMILDFAKQSEKIHGNVNASMKKVSLQPDQFESVNFSCYAEALKTLETITKSSLTTSIKPGNKLEWKAPSLSFENIKCRLRCQDCNNIFNKISHYLSHLSKLQHREMLMKFFQEAGQEEFYERGRFHLGLYTYTSECLKKNQPAVGTELVVTCISSAVAVEPIYLCFACRESFPQPSINGHFESQKHVVNTLLYQNPWALPFAWEENLDDGELRLMAWKEAEERGQNDIILKIADIPYSVFRNLDSFDYRQVLKNLQLYHTMLRREVPPCKTFCKLQQNDKFPLLGKQFLVKHNQINRRNQPVDGALCLLCQRRLWTEEAAAHVFSREHVTTFLNRFHPGSLSSNTDNAETLLDLAKQAAQIHTQSYVQEIILEKPIWDPCTYQKAISILASAKRKEGKGSLEPPIKPKMKLVPRATPKDVDQDHKNDGQKNLINTDKQEHKQIKEEKCAEETQTERRKASVGVKNTSETGQLIRVKTEKSSDEVKFQKSEENCKNTQKSKGVKTDGEKSPSIKQETIQLTDVQPKNERKRPNTTPEKSVKDACPNEEVGPEMTPKRPRLTSKDKSSPEQPAKKQNKDIKKEKDDVTREESDRKVLTEGLNRISTTFIECHCGKLGPIFLCGSCSLKIPAMDVIRHLTEITHQKMQRVVVNLDEKTHNNISKQSFHSIIQMLQVQQLWLGAGCNCSPTSSQSSAALHDQHKDIGQVVKKELVRDLEESAAAPDSFDTENTSQVKVPKSEIPHTSLTAPSVPSVTVNTTKLPPTCSQNDSKANVSLDTTVKLIKGETDPKIEGMAASNCIYSGSTSKPATSSSKSTERTFSSGATSSNATSGTKSRLSSEVRAASDVGARVTCTTPPSSKDKISPKYNEATAKTSAAPQIKQTSLVAAKLAKAPVNPMTHVKKSEGENTDVEAHALKRNPPSAPHPNTSMTPISEHKSPRKRPHVSASKTPSGNPPKVGTNQLIVVSCEGKKQVYCQLCSVKLYSSSHGHLTKPEHQLNYVMKKYPEWTAKESEMEKKLNHTVTLLAKIERDLPHTRSAQILEVKKEVYQELRRLSHKEAVEKVKAMMQLKNLQVSPCSAADTTGALRQDVSSSCEVSSSDDGMRVSCENTEMESVMKEDPNLDVDHSISDQTSDVENMEVDDVIQDQPLTLNQSDPEPTQSPGFNAENVTETESSPGAAPLPRHRSLDGEVIDLTQDQLQSSVHNKIPLRSQSEEIAGEVEISPVTHVAQCSKSVSASPCLQKALESPQNLSAVPICSPQLQTAASISTEQQNPPSPSHRAEQTPKQGAEPEEQSASQTQPRTLIGERAQGTSLLSSFLLTCGPDAEPVIGLACMWECQGNSQRRFFLCESCEEILSLKEIRPHMVSRDHQLQYLRKNHPDFLEGFWNKEELPEEFKMDILKQIVEDLALRERVSKVDAQCLVLESKSHEFVRKAPFSEALKIVKKIKNKKELRFFHYPFSGSQQPDQQPADHQNEKESTEILPAQTPETNQRGGSEAGKKTKNCRLEKRNIVGERVLCLAENPSCSKASPDSSVPGVGIYLNSQESSRDRHPQPVFTPNSSLPQTSNSRPESAHSTTISPTTGQNPKVFLRDEFPKISKRPADTSPETLLSSCTSSPLEHPLPTKCSSNPVDGETKPQPAPVSPSVDPTTLVLKDKDPKPEQTKTAVDQRLFAELCSMLKQRNFRINPTPAASASGDTEHTSPSLCFEGVGDLKSVNMDSVISTDKTGLDKKCQLVKDPVEKIPLCNSPESGVSSASSAKLLPEQLGMENLPAKVAKNKAVKNAASAADPSNPQNLPMVGVQDSFRKENSVINTCATTSETLRQTPESNTETKTTKTSQLPINTIITSRPNSVKHTLQTSNNRQACTNVSQDHWVTLPSNTPANLIDTVAASGASNTAHCQTTYFTGLDSSYVFSQAVSGFSTQSSNSISTASSYQQYMYPAYTYPEQPGNPFNLHSIGYSLAAQMPPRRESLELQQLQYSYYLWARESGSDH